MPHAGEQHLVILANHHLFRRRSDVAAGLVHPQQALTVDDLSVAIECFLSRGYEFATFRSLRENAARQCVLTFDDGYANNVNLLAVLERYRVPAVVFVVPEKIESQEPYWWDAVFRVGTRRGMSRRDVDALTQQMKRLSAEKFAAALKEFTREERLRAVGDDDRSLSRSELKQLASSPLIEIGNHTYSHRILSQVGNAEVAAEVDRAGDYLKELIGYVPGAIAYPNGEAPRSAASLPASIRFGVTLREVTNRCRGGVKDPLLLGRYLLWGGRDMRRQCLEIDEGKRALRQYARDVRSVFRRLIRA